MRTYRASSLGYSLEALVAPHLGFEPVDPPEFMQKAFDEGNRIEPLAIEKLRGRGWYIKTSQAHVNANGDYQIEVELEVIPGVAEVVGHLDGTGHPPDLPWGVVEIKSMGAKSWQDFNNNGWDSNSPLVEKYRWQASAYMLAANKPHWMVAWNKDTEELAIEFQETPFYTISDIANKLAQVEEFIEKGLVPDGCQDFPCPYYYLHPPKDEVAKADEELEKLLDEWLWYDQREKAAKFTKDTLRIQILALVGDQAAAKIKGECGVVVETYWQDEKEYTVKQTGKWVTRVQGPRKGQCASE